MVFMIAACLLLLALLNPVLVNHKSPEELPGRNASGLLCFCLFSSDLLAVVCCGLCSFPARDGAHPCHRGLCSYLGIVAFLQTTGLLSDLCRFPAAVLFSVLASETDISAGGCILFLLKG